MTRQLGSWDHKNSKQTGSVLDGPVRGSGTETLVGGQAANRPDIHREPAKPAPTIGRYTVLDRLGAGAMGQVYAAYDPKLDRRVALKLLHAHSSEMDAERLAREARALAQVSHPNVVAVHEVGEFDDQLAVAMEFVEGETLHRWMLGNWEVDDRKARAERALEILRQACDGLSAAHRNGLVHRDFKPANVLVGKDGRVRVADFGLARRMTEVPLRCSADAERASNRDAPPGHDLTQDGTTVGTRAYMAPEQLTGVPATERSDQYSFCVVAWQVLFGNRPTLGTTAPLNPTIPQPDERRTSAVPRRAEEALRRGLRRDPAKRHASMQHLRRELEPTPKRRGPRNEGRYPWRQLGLLGALIGALIGARAVHQHVERTRCEERAQTIETDWNRDVRNAVSASFLRTGTTYALSTANRVPFWLDEYAASWEASMFQACVAAKVQNEWTRDRFDKAQWCLHERRIGLQSLIEGFLRADANTVRGAVDAATDLEGIAPCTDEDWLRLNKAPPNLAARYASVVTWLEMGAAERHAEAGNLGSAMSLARSASRRARRTGWLPLLASALLREGSVLSSAGDLASAEVVLRESYRTSVSAGQWSTATLAASALAALAGPELGHEGEGQIWLDVGRTVNARTADLFGLRARILADRRAQLDALRGDHAAAIAGFEAALGHARSVFGIDHPRVGRALLNLGNGLADAGRLSEAEDAFRDSALSFEKALGEDHPALAGPLMGRSATLHQLGRDAQARPFAERGLRLLEGEYGPNHPALAAGLHRLAAVLTPLGEYDQAESLLLRSLQIQERTADVSKPRHSETLKSLATLYGATGRGKQAEAALEQAVRSIEATFGDNSPRLIDILNGLAVTKAELGAHAEALVLFQRSVDIREATNTLPRSSVTQAYAEMSSAATTLGRLESARHANGGKQANNRLNDDGSRMVIALHQARLGAALWLSSERGAPAHARAQGYALMRRASDAFENLGTHAEHRAAEAWLAAHPEPAEAKSRRAGKKDQPSRDEPRRPSPLHR